MTTIGELKAKIKDLPDTLPVVVCHRVKTGYDEGDVYHSEGITVCVDPNRQLAVIESSRTTLVGGW